MLVIIGGLLLLAAVVLVINNPNRRDEEVDQRLEQAVSLAKQKLESGKPLGPEDAAALLCKRMGGLS